MLVLVVELEEVCIYTPEALASAQRYEYLPLRKVCTRTLACRNRGSGAPYRHWDRFGTVSLPSPVDDGSFASYFFIHGLPMLECSSSKDFILQKFKVYISTVFILMDTMWLFLSLHIQPFLEGEIWIVSSAASLIACSALISVSLEGFTSVP